MSSPQMSFAVAGNIISSQSLAAGGTLSGYVLDFSASFEGIVQLDVTPGAAVAATNGVTATFYRSLGPLASPDVDTRGIPLAIGPFTANQRQAASIRLDTGRYEMTVVNADATNGVTCTVTSAVVSGVA